MVAAPDHSTPSQPIDAPTPATALLDRAGTVVGWSKAAEVLLGYRADEIANRPVGALLTTEIELPRPEDGDWSGLANARHRDGHDLSLGIHVCTMAGAPEGERWLVTAFRLGEGHLSGVNRSMLEGLLSHSPIGMAVMDTDLRYVWFNEALIRTSGAPDRLGRTISAVFPAEEAGAGEEKMRRVLETGVPLLGFEYRGPILSDPSSEHMYSASFFRLEDEIGRVSGLCYLVIDVTERWKARQRKLMLSRARECGGGFDLTHTAQKLAEICVPDFADLVTVDLLDVIFRGTDTSIDSSGDPILMRHAGRKSVDAEHVRSLPGVGDLITAGASSLISRCLTGKSVILQASLKQIFDAWAEEVQGRLAVIDECGFHSVILAPVCEGGTPLGIVTFMRSRGSKPFTQDDLLFAEEFAAHGSSALANTYRFTQERRISLTLQRSLLPGQLRRNESLDVAWRYFPTAQSAGVGGDWVDVIPLSGARAALVVGDVVGHGVNAAAAMGRLRAAVHTLAAMDLPPDELLAHLDDFVVRACKEQSGDKVCTTDGPRSLGTFGASCMYAIYDPVAHMCTVARAGHPAPVFVDPGGAPFIPDLPAGPPLGIGSIPFESTDIPCPQGTLLALYTDGLVERRDMDFDESLSRLCTILGRVDAPLEELCDEAVESLLSRPLCDDAALLLARTVPLSSNDVATWDVPNDPAFVREARALAARKLAEWDLDILQFTTELIVSELVTNAIRYGLTPVQLRLIRHSVLTCEVLDGSSTSPRLRHANVTEEGGRGLFLVAQCSERWGYRYTTSGKSIWVEQQLP